MNTSKSLDELIDTALHPERNGLLIKEQVAEGANYEWLVKRELKAAIVEAVEGLIIGNDEEVHKDTLATDVKHTRNELREAQRKAIKEWQ